MILFILLTYSEISSTTTSVTASFWGSMITEKVRENFSMFHHRDDQHTDSLGFVLSLIFLSSSFLLDPMLPEQIPV